MIDPEKTSQKDDSTKSRAAPPESRNLTTRDDLFERLNRSHDARARFVDSQVNKTLAFQIRSLRGDMSQEKAMEKLGMNQNAISRLENPYYGKATLTTLKRIAAAYDVGLLVEFVPFSKLVDHVSGTPHTDQGLNPATMSVPSFEEEAQQGAFDGQQASSSAASISEFNRLYSERTPTGELLEQPLNEQVVTDSARLDVSAPAASGGLSTPIAALLSIHVIPQKPRIRAHKQQPSGSPNRRRGGYTFWPRRRGARR
jgi:transcriptional regulator with XRE-family HTH domain